MSDQQTAPWYKTWRPFAVIAGIATLLIFYGDLRNGVVTAWNDAKWVFVERKEPVRDLRLINVLGVPGVEVGRAAQPGGVNALQLRALLYNAGDTVYTTVTKDDVEFEGGTVIPPSAPSRVQPLAKGLELNLFVTGLRLNMSNEANAIGKINWVVKYGFHPDKLDYEMPIKGLITVDTWPGKPPIFMWNPDDDSAEPIGMERVQVRKE